MFILHTARLRWVDNIKMNLREFGWSRMDWIDLAQDRDQWMALVNIVRNFWFHKMLGNSWVAAQMAVYQEGFSSMEIVSSVSSIYFGNASLNCFKIQKIRYLLLIWLISDRLCDLVIRVPAYRSRGPGLDFRLYQIFWEVVRLERSPLSLVSIIEELLEWKSSGSGLTNRY
jgi:hypothetical protein